MDKERVSGNKKKLLQFHKHRAENVCTLREKQVMRKQKSAWLNPINNFSRKKKKQIFSSTKNSAVVNLSHMAFKFELKYFAKYIKN